MEVGVTKIDFMNNVNPDYLTMYYATAPALIILKMIYERAATEAL